jgi:hypothetical protein
LSLIKLDEQKGKKVKAVRIAPINMRSRKIGVKNKRAPRTTGTLSGRD